MSDDRVDESFTILPGGPRFPSPLAWGGVGVSLYLTHSFPCGVESFWFFPQVLGKSIAVFLHWCFELRVLGKGKRGRLTDESHCGKRYGV